MRAMIYSTPVCSCGERETHIIARRRTFDGVTVVFYSDGDITFRMGIRPLGGGRSRDAGSAMRVSALLREEVSLYESAELGALIRTARAAIGQTSLNPIAYLRRRMAGEKFRSNGRVVKGQQS